MHFPKAKAIALTLSGCCFFPGTPALADTASSNVSWNSGVDTRFATPLSSGSVDTSFTAYSATAVPYVMGTFYVGNSGSFTATLNIAGISKGLQIIQGSFAPSAGTAPTTALANFLYGTQSSNTITIPNITLTGGQQYTYLLLFQGFTSGSNAQFTLDGAGCISLGPHNLCQPQYSRVSSPAALADASRSSMLAAFDQIGERLDNLRYQATAPLAGDEKNREKGLWLRFYGTRTQQAAQDGLAAYTGNGWGSIIGLDGKVADDLSGGIALAYSDTGTGYRNELAGNSNSVRSTQLSAYGSKTFGPYFIEGIAAYAQQKYDSRRDTVFNGYAYGNFAGEQWGARINGGMALHLSANTVATPQLRFDWNRIKQDSYKENGAGTLAVGVSANTTERLRSGLGAQLEYRMTIAGINARPYGSLFWQRDFRKRGNDVSASFVDGSSSFITPGPTLDRDMLAFAVGINFFTRNNFTSSIGYHLTAGKSYSTQTAQASANWIF